MKKNLLLIFSILVASSIHSAAQEKTTLYYDENWKGLDTKKKAAFYRIVTFDKDEKPIGQIEDYYKSGKLQGKGEASFIDKLDDSKSVWKNHQIGYSEKGIKLFEKNYDEDGRFHGMSYTFKDNGEKFEEREFVHGNPAKDYYLVYVKGQPVKYSYMTSLPMKLATSGKKIVPITERKLIYQDGQPIQYYTFDDISVAVRFTRDNTYGSYYAAYITIENGSDNQFDFDPTTITAVLSNKGKVEEAEVLSYEYYIKKVNRKQAWSAAFNAFAQQQAASQAGYSSSGTGAVVVNNSGGAAVGVSATQSYNGAAQYAANQNAANNINNYSNRQYNIKSSITQGYLKRNTIFPSSRVIGYVNIKYEKADGLILNIPINGKIYQF